MTASVHIDGLRVFARHGVLPQERTVGNTFEVSVRLDFDARDAMVADSLADTVNYAEAVEIIRQEMSRPSRLLENAVYRIHQALIEHFPTITGGHISLYKLQPPIPAEMRRVGFSIDW